MLYLVEIRESHAYTVQVEAADDCDDASAIALRYVTAGLVEPDDDESQFQCVHVSRIGEAAQ